METTKGTYIANEFKEYIKPFKASNDLVPAVFDVDQLLFAKGFHNPHVRWNGWAVPYFPKDQFEKNIFRCRLHYRSRYGSINLL